MVFQEFFTNGSVCVFWKNVDLDEGIILVVKNPLDIAHSAVIAGDAALRAWRDWRAVLGPQRSCVFPSVGSGDNIGPDLPSTEAVYQTVRQTQKLVGNVFTAQDAHRMFLVVTLGYNSPVVGVQKQVGQRDPNSTLRYTQTVDAAQPE